METVRSFNPILLHGRIREQQVAKKLGDRKWTLKQDRREQEQAQ